MKTYQKVKGIDDVKLDELLEAFREEVHNKAEEIDPDNELDWFSFSVGWGLGKSLDPDTAFDLSSHIRYKTVMG
jgi:hypothetical protein